jgi:uncharacterized protein involved in response to NO
VAGPVADFIGVVGTVAMCGAVVLTIYSFGIYIWRYGMIFVRPRAGARQAP